MLVIGRLGIESNIALQTVDTNKIGRVICYKDIL